MIFLKILFWIWLSVTIINLLLLFGCSFSVVKAIKQSGRKIQITTPTLETLIANLRVFVISALPIFHILFLFVNVFNYDKIYENTLEKAQKEIEIFLSKNT